VKSAAFFVLAMFVSFSSFAQQLELPLEPQQCITRSDAQKILKSYLSPLIGQVLSEDFPWVREDGALLSKEIADSAVASLTWDSKSFSYESTWVVEDYCAPGASCWGWYTVDCSGRIEPRTDGED